MFQLRSLMCTRPSTPSSSSAKTPKLVMLRTVAFCGDTMLPVTRTDEKRAYTAQYVVPIIASGDPIGAVALLSREPNAAFTQADMKVAETAAAFLGRQLEN